MRRPSGDEDGDAGELPAPACPRHRVHSRGGKPFPPTVHLMQHAGTLVGTEWQAPCHRSVHQGRGAEEVAASGGGAEGDLIEGLRGIQGAAGDGTGVSIPGTGIDSGR